MKKIYTYLIFSFALLCSTSLIAQTNEKARETKESKRTDLCGTALHLFDAFFSFCACIGGRNEKRSGEP